jgi:hypothetical protein
VIEHDSQIGDLVGEADNSLNQIRLRIRGVQREICGGQIFDAVDELRPVNLGHEVSAPQVSVTNTSKEGILMISAQICTKLRLVWLKIPDGADHDRIFFGDLQNPKIVLYPGAGFGFDCAYDAEGYGYLSVRRRIGDG